MWLIIIAAIILYLRLPLLGLHQSIYNPIIPLRLKDILTALNISSKDSGIRLSITQSLISDAIKRLHTASINFIFRNSNHYPKITSMHYLNINQTKF